MQFPKVCFWVGFLLFFFPFFYYAFGITVLYTQINTYYESIIYERKLLSGCIYSVYCDDSWAKKAPS